MDYLKVPLKILGEVLCATCKTRFHEAMVKFGAAERLLTRDVHEKRDFEFTACPECERALEFALGPSFNDFRKK